MPRIRTHSGLPLGNSIAFRMMKIVGKRKLPKDQQQKAMAKAGAIMNRWFDAMLQNKLHNHVAASINCMGREPAVLELVTPKLLTDTIQQTVRPYYQFAIYLGIAATKNKEAHQLYIEQFTQFDVGRRNKLVRFAERTNYVGVALWLKTLTPIRSPSVGKPKLTLVYTRT